MVHIERRQRGRWWARYRGSDGRLKLGHLRRFDPAEIEPWLDRARRPLEAG
jgi:hypothetical protein